MHENTIVVMTFMIIFMTMFIKKDTNIISVDVVLASAVPHFSQ
jgi:hypothetical protein